MGNLGCLTARIRETAPKGRIVIMTPVERGDYVCIGDPGCQTMEVTARRQGSGCVI